MRHWTAWESVTSLPAAFWIITISQLFQNAAVETYISLSASMVQDTRGASNLTSGYTAAVGQVIPIVVTPLVGLFFDMYGHRMFFVSATAALYIIVFGLLGFTQVNAFIP